MAPESGWPLFRRRRTRVPGTFFRLFPQRRRKRNAQRTAGRPGSPRPGSQVHKASAVKRAGRLPRPNHVALHLRRDGTMVEPEETKDCSHSAKTRQSAFPLSARQQQIVGPLKLSLYASVEGATDACLFAGLRKLDSQGQEVHFEGSCGMGQDVSHGFLQLSHRELDPEASTNIRPVHRHLCAQPPSAGEVVAIEMELLHRHLAGRRRVHRACRPRSLAAPHKPHFRGAAAYESIPQGTVTIHLGPDHRRRCWFPCWGPQHNSGVACFRLRAPLRTGSSPIFSTAETLSWLQIPVDQLPDEMRLTDFSSVWNGENGDDSDRLRIGRMEFSLVRDSKGTRSSS